VEIELDEVLERLREICVALPEVSERLSHGSPSFFIRDKKLFVTVDDHHHGSEWLALWCAAAAGVQEHLVETEGDRFFRPPYVGHRGWLGVRLDVDLDWDEIAAIAREAYLQVAPKTLARQLEEGGEP
jgi:hypothetical protein